MLEESFETILGEKVSITGAGRTDTGVHATDYIAHFDTSRTLVEEELVYKLNSLLPKSIAVFDIVPVNDEAHARFDAKARTYEYHINVIKDPFRVNSSWYVRKDLDVKRMNEAAQILPEYTDFKCFSKVKTDVKTYDCTITAAHWEAIDHCLVFTITANRFLRNMVRAIVGTLVNVGTGKTSPDELHQIIKSRNRSQAGSSVPAHGLYLTKIEYPTHLYL
ncbi:tRNA pseudouridine(38-40) synthase TruA [Gangjinia marincola]|uniref:tRNA pseudouridine synthase n=2 Tax=Gangjinia marincola TaxID=578463 RepID=A0ABN1MJR1_9FLAO